MQAEGFGYQTLNSEVGAGFSLRIKRLYLRSLSGRAAGVGYRNLPELGKKFFYILRHNGLVKNSPQKALICLFLNLSP